MRHWGTFPAKPVSLADTIPGSRFVFARDGLLGIWSRALLHFEMFELWMLEDGSARLESLWHRVAERTCDPRDQLVHVLRLGNQARFVAGLPVVSLISHYDTDAKFYGEIGRASCRERV